MGRVLVFAFIMGFLAVSFNNCGRVLPIGTLQSGVIALQSSSGKALCEQQLMNVYRQTYHPFLSTTCGACHDQHGNSHGSSDIKISFAAFQSKGQTTIEGRATTQHGGGYSPAESTPALLTSFKPIWADASEKFQACLTQAESGGSSAFDLKLMSKLLDRIEATKSNGTLWIQYSWNTGTEPDQNVDLNRLKATFSIEGRLVLGAGSVVTGIVFRNPSMQLQVGQSGPVQINDLGLYIDESEITQFTTYRNDLLKPVSGTDLVNMAPDSGGAFAAPATPLSNSSRVSFRLSGVRVDSGKAIMGPTTTFTELNGSNALKNVFARTCNSCHSPGGSAGLVLDLTNYSAARGSTAQILQSINNGSMPQGQPLSNADRSQVQSWVNGGAPQ